MLIHRKNGIPYVAFDEKQEKEVWSRKKELKTVAEIAAKEAIKNGSGSGDPQAAGKAARKAVEDLI